MVHRQGGAGAPPGVRDELNRALAVAALDPKATPAIPFMYALDLLARRYHVPPGSLREWEAEDLSRALAFARMEASVKVT